MFRKEALGRVFVSVEEKVTRKLNRLSKEELCNLQFSSNIARIKELRRVICLKDIACLKQGRNADTGLIEELVGEDDLSVDRRTRSSNCGVRVWFDLRMP